MEIRQLEKSLHRRDKKQSDSADNILTVNYISVELPKPFKSMTANIKRIEDLSDFHKYKECIISLVPQNPVYAVTKEQHEQELKYLRETIGSRRFFFSINLEKYEIENAFGIERWLGYSDKEFSMKKYHDIFHPGRKKGAKLVAFNFMNTYCSGSYPLSFMVQRYSTLVALKHYNGHYVTANKITSVFQHDVDNRLTSCLHEFTIIKDFENEALTPSFFMSNGDEDQRGKEIMKKTVEQFERLKVFSPKEMQVARKLAYNPGLTRTELAEALEISVDDLHQYYNRFLKKARSFFGIEFNSTVEAAVYVKQEGLL